MALLTLDLSWCLCCFVLSFVDVNNQLRLGFACRLSVELHCSSTLMQTSLVEFHYSVVSRRLLAMFLVSVGLEHLVKEPFLSRLGIRHTST